MTTAVGASARNLLEIQETSSAMLKRIGNGSYGEPRGRGGRLGQPRGALCIEDSNGGNLRDEEFMMGETDDEISLRRMWHMHGVWWIG